MFDIVAPEVYFVLRPIFTACYLMWAFLWTQVGWYYGHAAYASWRASNGRWRFVVNDILQPFWWAIKQTLCRWKMFEGRAFCGVEIPSPYESGHLLRFSIFMGSLTPITFGLQFAELDRSDWTYAKIFLTLIFASTSIFAAGGHLFLAYRSRPEAWRKLIFRCTLWLFFAPPVIACYYVLWGPDELLPWTRIL